MASLSSFLSLFSASQQRQRYLQVATLANDGVSEGTQATFWIPYAVGLFGVLGILYLSIEFGHYLICKHVFGREDPIDPNELLNGLTEEQRTQAITAIITEGCDSSDSDSDSESSTTKQATTSILSFFKKNEATKSKDDIEAGGITSAKTTSTQEVNINEDNEATEPAPTAAVADHENENHNVCPICLGSLDGSEASSLLSVPEPVFASHHCRHKFHKDCILEWLLHTKRGNRIDQNDNENNDNNNNNNRMKNEHNNDCPVCRVEVISKDEMVDAALGVVRQQKKQGQDPLEKS